MKHPTTFLSIVFSTMMIILGTLNTTAIGQTSSGGSGGGGGSSTSFILPPFNDSSQVTISGPGYNLHARSQNNEAKVHTYTYYDENNVEQTYEWPQPKQGMANFYGYLDQGAFAGQNFVPAGNEIRVDYYGGMYYVNVEMKIFFTGNTLVDWTEPETLNASNNGKVFGGATYNIGLSVEHKMNHWHNEAGECIEEETPDLRLDVYANFQESEIRNLELSTDIWSYWYNDVEYPGARISGRFTVETDDLWTMSDFKSVVSSTQAIPEPATFGLLTLGAIALFRRRRNAPASKPRVRSHSRQAGFTIIEILILMACLFAAVAAGVWAANIWP